MTANLRDLPTTRPTRQYQEPYQDYRQRLHHWSKATRERLMRNPDYSRYELIIQLRSIVDDIETGHVEFSPSAAIDKLNLIADQLDELLRALITLEDEA